MKSILYISIFLLGSSFILYKSHLPNNQPTHFVLDKEWQGAANSEPAFVFKNTDTLIEHQMQLLRDEHGLPILYYADIQTPVCIDGLCKPVYIEMYWDLIGQYAGFGVYPDHLLTKFDHDLFEEKDYSTLHQLLLDQNSVLGRRQLAQLYEKEATRTETIQFKGVEIDGISGATKKEIKASIVDGGLYSCYKLWHLAYGQAAEKIRAVLPTIYSDSLANYFLKAKHESYQFYAIKQLKQEAFEKKISAIVPILKEGKPLARGYLLKKMPKELFQHPSVINGWYKNIADFDLNTKTLLIKNLQYSNSTAIRLITKQLSNLSENQLKTFLSIVEKRNAITFIKENLKAYSLKENAPHNYLVKEFLSRKEPPE